MKKYLKWIFFHFWSLTHWTRESYYCITLSQMDLNLARNLSILYMLFMVYIVSSTWGLNLNTYIYKISICFQRNPEPPLLTSSRLPPHWFPPPHIWRLYFCVFNQSGFNHLQLLYACSQIYEKKILIEIERKLFDTWKEMWRREKDKELGRKLQSLSSSSFQYHIL